MNLALCYESVAPARGGCETYIADLIRRLVADRHEVHLYGYERDARALPEAVIFHALMLKLAPRFLRPWRFARACELALRRQDHDVVVGFVKTWRQDVILPQGGLHAASARGNLRKFRNPLVRGLVRLARWVNPTHWSYKLLERRQYAGKEHPLVIAASRMVQDDFRRFFRLDADRVQVIPNAIDPKRFVERDRLKLRAELREHLEIMPEDALGLFVGHNYRLKGLGPLLHAVKAMRPRPFRLLVCGSRKTAAYERLARQLGIARQVRFLGYCGDVRQAFFASDFLVHPTFYDPCSLVVLEALACGLPVITSRFNGASELLNPPEDGLVLDDPHDAPALARAIERLCDPRVRSECSQAARLAAARWTFEDHYRAVLGVLEEAARRRQAA
jgi:UDP-glucose:(heptosyl)LPS alpha-1,3-glucosyltransferase